MMLSRDPERIRSLERLAQKRSRQLGLPAGTIKTFRATDDQLRDTPLWTDDYSDLFAIVRPFPIRFNLE